MDPSPNQLILLPKRDFEHSSHYDHMQKNAGPAERKQPAKNTEIQIIHRRRSERHYFIMGAASQHLTEGIGANSLYRNHLVKVELKGMLTHMPWWETYY